MRTLLSLFAVLSAALPAVAQSVDDLQIKERSSFSVAPDARNPFLPIGWKKPEPMAAGPVAPAPVKQMSDAFFKPERFVVTSISIGALPLALINGRTYGEGDLIPVPEGVSVQVYSIRDGQVTLRFRDKTIVTTIQQKTEHKRP